MSIKLYKHLFQFSCARAGIGERVRYIFLSHLFYIPMVLEGLSNQGTYSASVDSGAGDDIYPLF